MKIGLIIGSLRRESWNRKVAMAVQGLLPADYESSVIELRGLSLYDADLEGADAPEGWKLLRESARGYDAFLLFTPEYNRSYAPALKNALDILSRDPLGSPLSGKPVAVFSASPGTYGGMMANHALRPVLSSLGMIPMQQPEVALSKVNTCFEGGVPVEATQRLLQKAVNAYVEFAGIWLRAKDKE